VNYVEITRNSMKRALIAAGLRYDGLTYREVGEQMGGISVETARQAVAKGQRIIERCYVALNDAAELIARGAVPQTVSTREPQP
jgi:lambda repressor-like predicted transcriptional regulator